MPVNTHGVADRLSRHALVIGGTGMLRGVCLHLAASGYVVSVLARGSGRLKELIRLAGPHGQSIVPIEQDYREITAFRRSLHEANSKNGPIRLCVGWISSDAVETHETTADALGSLSSWKSYLEVRGSSWAKPAGPVPGWEARFLRYSHLRYRVVTLGFMMSDGRARWLTHDEISDGVIRAIDGDTSGTVGIVRPWSARPRRINRT